MFICGGRIWDRACRLDKNTETHREVVTLPPSTGDHYFRQYNNYFQRMEIPEMLTITFLVDCLQNANIFCWCGCFENCLLLKKKKITIFYSCIKIVLSQSYSFNPILKYTVTKSLKPDCLC